MPMKVKLTVEIVVDRSDWEAEYGTFPSADDVREDVRSYFTNHLLCAPAVSHVGLTVRVS